MEFKKLGTTVMTNGVNIDIAETEMRLLTFINKCLARYQKCDWGEMCQEDIDANNQAINEGARVFASYKLPDDLRVDTGEEKIWIITEWDRSYTTILYPSEY